MSIRQDEKEAISRLTKELYYYRLHNSIKEAYYDGKNRLKNPNIALPEGLKDMMAPVSWPENVVERKIERMNLLGFTAPDDIEIDDIFNDNDLEVQSTDAHRDALLYGVSYAIAGVGVGEFEPEILITVESPNDTVGTPNRRSRDLDDLLQIQYNKEGRPAKGFYSGRYRDIEFIYNMESAVNTFYDFYATEDLVDITVVEIREHNRGFVPAVQFVNRPRGSRQGGQSEITSTVIGHTDQACITFAEMAVARELYATPQRYFLGAPDEAFKDADGKPISRWDAALTTMWMTGPMKDGKNHQGTGGTHAPQIGQFPATSPAPLLEGIRSHAEQITAASGIPLPMLGYSTENPASAEALNVVNEPLIKSAEDKMKSFGMKWVQLMRFALRLKNDGALPDNANQIQCHWKSAATPTKAQDADAVVKLVGKGILPADSEVTYNYLNLPESDRQILRKEKEERFKLELLDKQIELARLQQGVSAPVVQE